MDLVMKVASDECGERRVVSMENVKSQVSEVKCVSECEETS